MSKSTTPCPTRAASTTARTTGCWFCAKKIATRATARLLNISTAKDNSERWRQFVAFVESNKAYRLAKRSRLLRKDFGEKEAKEFRERNLNDTRYICKFFKNYVEQYLQLHEDSEAKRCVVLSGQMTSFLRARWGLGQSARRSATATTRWMPPWSPRAATAWSSACPITRAARNWNRYAKALWMWKRARYVNPAMFDQIEKHFPNPWPHFRDELRSALANWMTLHYCAKKCNTSALFARGIARQCARCSSHAHRNDATAVRHIRTPSTHNRNDSTRKAASRKKWRSPA